MLGFRVCRERSGFGFAGLRFEAPNSWGMFRCVACRLLHLGFLLASVAIYCLFLRSWAFQTKYSSHALEALELDLDDNRVPGSVCSKPAGSWVVERALQGLFEGFPQLGVPFWGSL